MAQYPKITVVTPSFNQAQYLEECIQSVLSQGYPNLEYMVLDGGSSDDSSGIIKKYERHLAYWRSHPDGGQYAAIQEGLERSTGDIIAWLNSDDKYHPGAFFKAAFVFETQPSVEWLMGLPTTWDASGRFDGTHLAVPSWTRGRFLRLDYCWIQQESCFWRRALWHRAGGYLRHDLSLAADLELWTRFFRCAKLHSSNLLLGGFRVQPAQKTALQMDAYIAEAEAILRAEQSGFAIRVEDDIAPESLTPDLFSDAFLEYEAVSRQERYLCFGATDLLARVRCFLTAGQYAHAEPFSRRAVALMPELAAVWVARSATLRLLDRLDEAWEAALRSVDVETTPDGLGELIIISRLRGEYRKAQEYISTFRQRYPARERALRAILSST